MTTVEDVVFWLYTDPHLWTEYERNVKRRDVLLDHYKEIFILASHRSQEGAIYFDDQVAPELRKNRILNPNAEIRDDIKDTARSFYNFLYAVPNPFSSGEVYYRLETLLDQLARTVIANHRFSQKVA